MNTFGERIRVTTYGESHGLAVGAIIDGYPAGVKLDFGLIDTELHRRSANAPRNEKDSIEWLSGIMDGTTLGTPIAFIVRNTDARSSDYQHLKDVFRPGHADYTYQQRYGLRDYRGGGRASARETVARVVAGAMAKQIISPISISSKAIDGVCGECPDDTIGGIVECRIDGVPAGIGNPVFGKLNARLAAAMMSIPSAIGFEMGEGFAAASMRGSQYIDRWLATEYGKTATNHCGGIQGGISNGMPIWFRVAFHPVVSLPTPVEGLHKEGHLEETNIGGRHDMCHVRRAAVVVEAMAAMCIADYIVDKRG